MEQAQKGRADVHCDATPQSYLWSIGCESKHALQVERVDVYPNDFIIGEMLLGMELIETKGALAGNLAFNRDVFTEACAERITGQLQVCTRPKCAVPLRFGLPGMILANSIRKVRANNAQ